ncbi:MAG: hypothetical protein WA418_33615 [Bradyrhizobium sp.]
MGKPEEPYILIVVETYLESGSGLHGDLHVRPIAGQALPSNLRVRFPKSLRCAHPLHTRFLVYAKLTDKEGGNEFVHTNHAWDVQVLGPPPAGDDLRYKKRKPIGRIGEA